MSSPWNFLLHTEHLSNDSDRVVAGFGELWESNKLSQYTDRLFLSTMSWPKSPKKLPRCFNGKMLFVICNVFRRYDTGVTWCVMWSVGLVTPQTVSNFLNRHASWQLILLLLWIRRAYNNETSFVSSDQNSYFMPLTVCVIQTQICDSCCWTGQKRVAVSRDEYILPDFWLLRFKQNGFKEGESPTLWQHLCN